MQHSHTPLILIWMRYCLIHSFSICDSLQQKILELYYIYIWTTKVYCILIVVCNWLPNPQFDYLILDIVLLYLVRTWIWYYLRTHLSIIFGFHMYLFELLWVVSLVIISIFLLHKASSFWWKPDVKSFWYLTSLCKGLSSLKADMSALFKNKGVYKYTYYFIHVTLSIFICSLVVIHIFLLRKVSNVRYRG